MRKPIHGMTVSLDGYIAGPDGAIDWTVHNEELFLLPPSRYKRLVCSSALGVCWRPISDAQ